MERLQQPFLESSSKNAQTTVEEIQHEDDQHLLTVAVIYYEAATHLTKHITLWIRLPGEILSKIRLTVVDDGSQLQPASDVIRENSQILRTKPTLNISLLRIHEDIPWNIGGARNLIAHTVQTKYFFMTDVDIMLPEDIFPFFLQLLRDTEEHRIKEGIETVYTSFPRRMGNESHPIDKPHPALMLLSHQAYWSAGGCDEDFAGSYGYTDPHFRWRLGHTKGVRTIHLAKIYPHAPYLREIQEESGKKLERNKTRNYILFDKKRNDVTAWSCVYLRFNWSFVTW